ncbi:MAG: sialate O-acetylesterase, partial [Treponema sp.]|nr:sialate O-acetylesterase [Treponema sp.]
MKKILTIFLAGFLLTGALLFSACDDPDTGRNPKFHIYIAFGQSNMQGPGAIEDVDRANVTDRFRILNVIADTYAGESRAKSEWYTAA